MVNPPPQLRVVLPTQGDPAMAVLFLEFLQLHVAPIPLDAVAVGSSALPSSPHDGYFKTTMPLCPFSAAAAHNTLSLSLRVWFLAGRCILAQTTATTIIGILVFC